MALTSFGHALAEANRLHCAGDLASAERVYLELLCSDPLHAFVHYSLGTLYCDQGRNGLAIPLLTRAVELDPKMAPAWSNLGAVMRQERHIDHALAVLENAAALDPQNPHVYANLSGCFINEGKPERAIAYARKGLAIDPDNPQCGNHLAQGHLERGDWREGWAAYDARLRLPKFSARTFGGAPRWDGEPTECLALSGEQGIGDEIMFLSILDDVIARAKGRVCVEVTKRLVPLVHRSYPDVAVYPDEDAVMAAELPTAFCPLGSLGALLRNSDKEFPREPRAYLKPDPALVERMRAWTDALPGHGPLIGIAWRGGVKATHDKLRKCPLSEWEPILSIEGVRFVSVQYGGPQWELEARQFGVPHWPEVVDDFEALTALISICDRVVTVNQTAVHQAGALGVPALVLTPSRPAWRYQVKGERMAWYPQHRQFRQAAGGTWTPVVRRVAEEIAGMVRRAAA